jgi:DNA helicase-2/ATP-dependent DNA helicase PcrA
MIDKYYPYQQRYKILGGPGCGKTTKILNILSNYIKGGLKPDQALLIGFARATVKTLQDRVVEQKLLTEKESESITTIHKFCKDKIGGGDVFNTDAKKSFKKKYMTDPDKWIMLDDEKYDSEDEIAALWSENQDKKLYIYYDIINKALHEYGYDKNKRHGKDELDKILNWFGESENHKYKNVHTEQLIYFYNCLKNFKSQNGMIDFDDMLIKALYPTVEFPKYEVVLVDEAQDLSKLEWEVISKIARKTRDLYLVGDDDQAIYGWKGSNVRIFQKWPCRKENVTRLERTHRLPGKIYDFAISIRDQIKTRLGNEFFCKKRIETGEEGAIDYVYGLDEIEDIGPESEVIFCARAKTLCRPYAFFLKHKGLAFLEKSQSLDERGKFTSSFPDNCRKVIEYWNTLQEGGSIQGKHYIHMVKNIKKEFISDRKKTALTNKDTSFQELYSDELFSYEKLKEKYYLNCPKEKVWHEIFWFDTKRVISHKKPKALFEDRADFNDYLKRCWEKNPTLKTKIIVSTIHGVKGMEADKVVIGVEWGFSLDAYMLGDDRKEDEELRVCYVGVTRCKNNLYLFEVPGEYRKPFPLLQNYIRNTKKEKQLEVDNHFYKIIERMEREVYGRENRHE